MASADPWGKYSLEQQGGAYHYRTCRDWGSGAGHFRSSDASRLDDDPGKICRTVKAIEAVKTSRRRRESALMAVTELGLTNRRAPARRLQARPKPRITLMVLITTLVGFYMGSEGTLQRM